MRDVREYYNTIARGYDELYGNEQIAKLMFAVSKGLNFLGKKVIDVGCGSGIITEKILEMEAREVVGIDISEELIKIAKRRVKDAKFIVADALKIPFENKYFDLCVSFTVMQDIPKERWKKFVDECIRVAREAWITVLKRNKSVEEIISIIQRVPDEIWEEEKDYVIVFRDR